jgi:type II secretory pathway pseudopilin PulG
MAPATPTGEGPPSGGGRAGERGFVLAFLVGLLTVLAIALTAALPQWAAMAQREKESELISRGTQYAEAIRVFQRRFGRLPTRLDELVEVEPRSIRRLWKNPIDPAAGWLLLVEAGGGVVVPVDPKTGAIVGAGGAEGEESSDATLPEGESAPPAADGVGAAPGTVVTGNIHGVKSRAKGEAYHVFFGRKDYGEWEFTVDTWVAATGELTPGGLPRRMTAATFGRPFFYSAPTGSESGTGTESGGQSGSGDEGDGKPAPESPPDADPSNGDGGAP